MVSPTTAAVAPTAAAAPQAAPRPVPRPSVTPAAAPRTPPKAAAAASVFPWPYNQVQQPMPSVRPEPPQQPPPQHCLHPTPRPPPPRNLHVNEAAKAPTVVVVKVKAPPPGWVIREEFGGGGRGRNGRHSEGCSDRSCGRRGWPGPLSQGQCGTAAAGGRLPGPAFGGHG